MISGWVVVGAVAVVVVVGWEVVIVASDPPHAARVNTAAAARITMVVDLMRRDATSDLQVWAFVAYPGL
jgi:hypothetical protein